MEKNKRQKVWLEDVLTDVLTDEGVTGIEGTDTGLEVVFDPSLMSISEINGMMMLAERDELFTDYYVDIEEGRVHFNY